MKLRYLGLALTAVASGAQAAISTVGTHGSFSTIQMGIDEALAHGAQEVRVEVGTYPEAIYVSTASAVTLTISGGWNSTFTTQVRNGGETTVIAPAAGNTAFDLRPGAGTWHVSAFKIQNAWAYECAGLHVVESGTADVTLESLHVVGNVAEHIGDTTRGGGGCIDASGSGTVDLSNSVFSANVATAAPGATSGNAAGGGLSVDCSAPATCRLYGVDFYANRLEPNLGDGYGGGLNVAATGTFSLRNSLFESQNFGNGVFQGVSLRVVATGAADARIERVELRGDSVSDSYTEFDLLAKDQAYLQLLDSQFAHATRVPLTAVAADDSFLWIGFDTIADNAYGPLISGASSNAAQVYDCIFFNPDAGAFHNGDALIGGSVTTTKNLIGVDPGFLAPTLFDYSLRRTGSPAMDTGNANFLPVGSENLDLPGGQRLQGNQVDIGAYESSDRIFADRVDG